MSVYLFYEKPGVNFCLHRACFVSIFQWLFQVLLLDDLCSIIWGIRRVVTLLLAEMYPRYRRKLMFYLQKWVEWVLVLWILIYVCFTSFRRSKDTICNRCSKMLAIDIHITPHNIYLIACFSYFWKNIFWKFYFLD